MKKRGVVFLVCICMVLLMLPATALAAGTTQDNITMGITTDKSSYSAGDSVTVTVELTNNNMFAVEGAKLEVSLPEGLEFVSGQKTVTTDLPAAGSKTVSLTAKAVQAGGETVPQTGSNTGFGGYLLVLLIASGAAVGLFVWKKRGAMRFFSVLLCLALIAPFTATIGVYAQTTEPAGKTFSASCEVSVGEDKLSVQATLTYTLPDNPEYAVTVNGGTGGGNFTAGAMVTIVADEPASGMVFDGWSVDSGGAVLDNPDSMTTTFTMPGNAVEVTAHYTLEPISFASNQPVQVSTLVGGLVGSPAFVGNNGSAAGVMPYAGSIDLTGNADVLALAQTIPSDSNITEVSSGFVLSNAQTLIGTTVTVHAAVLAAADGGNVYTAIPGTEMTLAPGLTGVLPIGQECTGTISGLMIPVTTGTKVIMVFYVEAEGIMLINTIAGTASGSITLQL